MEKSEFLCSTIKQEYDQTKKAETKTFTRHGITIHLWAGKDSKDVNFEKLAKRIFKLVKWIRQFPQSKWSHKQQLVIYLFLTSQKKQWCSDKPTLTICNVNSGETYFSPNNITIRVWRREDFCKVLIHELLHAMNWDSVIEPNDSHRLPWMQNEQEAFIEANARYLYCHVLAKWYPQKTFQQYWQKELLWMQSQANFLRRSRWKTTTNAMAYYLMVAALLLSPHNEFIRWVYVSKKYRKQMAVEWLTKRSEWWNHFYHNSTGFWLPESTAVVCHSLRMVATQVPLQ